MPTNATGLVIGNGATISPFGTTATSGYSFIATAVTGSTTTELTLGADASNIDGVYDGLEIMVNGETKIIDSYDITVDATGAMLSKIAKLNTALSGTPEANTKLAINSANGWPTKAVTGSTATTILLGPDASAIDGIYDGFAIQVGGETKIITSYDVVLDASGNVVSKTATLDFGAHQRARRRRRRRNQSDRRPPPWPCRRTPATSAAPITASRSRGGRQQDRLRLHGDLRPETSQPVMRVAKIKGLTGTSVLG